MPIYTYTTLDDPNVANGTGAFGINDNGQIVGEYITSPDGVHHGFLYSNGTYTTLDDPLGIGSTIATGINASGLIVGYYNDASFHGHGFLYNPNGSTYTPIGHPSAGPMGTFVQGINDAGQIVGYYFDASDHMHGFLYIGGTYITLDDPTATNGTAAYGINSSGQIVGYYNKGSGVHGFLLTITPNT